MADFTPVLARIERAHEHEARLGREVVEYVERPPYRRTEQFIGNGNIVDRVDMVLRPPIGLAISFSDGVHQLRAALDNLVGVLRPGGPTAATAFPFERNPERWEERARIGLEGLSAEHVEQLRRLQPFPNNPCRTVGENLLALHDLARLDRHRAPLLQAGIVKPAYASGEINAFRGDLRTWAETEYEPGKADAIHYRVDVLVAEPVAGIEGHQAASLLVWLTSQVEWIVDAIRRGVLLDMLGSQSTDQSP